MNLFDINALAVRFAAARKKLSAILDTIRDQQQAAVRQHRAALRLAVNEANTRQAALADAIRTHPELFVKPRTAVVDGVRFGMDTTGGGIEFDHAEEVVAAIKKKFPVFIETLIRREEKPDKKALAKLTDEQLEKIGCRRAPTDGHSILIKPTDSEVDKLVSVLLEKIEDRPTESLPA
jgi:hypothetical protein